MGMKVPSPAQTFWDRFLATQDPTRPLTFYESFYFADCEVAANELAELVLAGTKRATASLLWVNEFENKPLPEVGDHSIVTNWAGDPLCIIQTTHLVEMPFDEVSSAFAFEEGEGDKSLRSWRESHWAYFARECGRIGKAPHPKMPILCEHFKVVYLPPGQRRSPLRTPDSNADSHSANE